jgi:cytoskeletal protein CcmA (bactofilin family)
MSKIPVPPKRSYKNRVSTQQAPEIASTTSTSRPASGSGFNGAKKLHDSAFDFDVVASRPPRIMAPKNVPPKVYSVDNQDLQLNDHESNFVQSLHDILDQAPDVVIGEDVEIKGDFQFDGLLHLYGRFEGRLLSEGDIYMGPKAVLKSNLQNINRLIVDGGHVIGRISVQQLGIAGSSFVKGDITCKYVEINSDDCTILGKLYVHPEAPNIVEFPRERLSQKEDMIVVSGSMKTVERSPSSSKETIEVSIQAADPDEILTPAELALRAKLEAKERRKEAKRNQQDEALRQSHGLASLSAESPKKKKSTDVPLWDTNSLQLSPEKEMHSVSPLSPTGESHNLNNSVETKESPIKLVSDYPQESIAESAHSRPPKTIDHWATDSAATDESTNMDDIHSPQKTLTVASNLGLVTEETVTSTDAIVDAEEATILETANPTEVAPESSAENEEEQQVIPDASAENIEEQQEAEGASKIIPDASAENEEEQQEAEVASEVVRDSSAENEHEKQETDTAVEQNAQEESSEAVEASVQEDGNAEELVPQPTSDESSLSEEKNVPQDSEAPIDDVQQETNPVETTDDATEENNADQS